jgi:hypothetical protein
MLLRRFIRRIGTLVSFVSSRAAAGQYREMAIGRAVAVDRILLILALMTCGCKIISRKTRCPSHQHRSKVRACNFSDHILKPSGVNIRVHEFARENKALQSCAVENLQWPGRTE